MTGGRFGLPVEPDGDIDPIARMKKLTEGRTIAEFVWKASHISFIFDDGWRMDMSVPFGPGIAVSFFRPSGDPA